MKRLFFFASLAAAFASDVCVKPSSGSLPVDCATLYAGQTIEVGTVCVQVSGSDLVVTYDTSFSAWLLKETHLWVGDSVAAMQTVSNDAGIPQPGSFPYKTDPHDPMVSSFTYNVPLSSFQTPTCPGGADQSVFLLAHATVWISDTQPTETAWSTGTAFDEKRWGWYSTFTLTCDCGAPPPTTVTQCETSFAQGSECFIGITGVPGFSTERWGWTLPISKSTSSEPIGVTIDLWAGAAQCDTSKGQKSGTVTYTYNSAGELTVDYATADGWVLGETQLYAGTTKLPFTVKKGVVTYTVAPGLYGQGHTLLQTTQDQFKFTVAGQPENIWLIAHAVTCHEVPVVVVPV